jgi:hypothetical protein
MLGIADEAKMNGGESNPISQVAPKLSAASSSKPLRNKAQTQNVNKPSSGQMRLTAPQHLASPLVYWLPLPHPKRNIKWALAHHLF